MQKQTKQRLRLLAAAAIIVCFILILLHYFKLIGAHASAPRPNPAMPYVIEWVPAN